MLRLLLLAVLVGGILVVKFVPWWGIVGLLAAGCLALRFVGGRILRSLFEKPFRMKGAVLRNATAEVHAVEPAPAPEETPEPEYSEETPVEFFWLDVTITPQASTGPFTVWEPGELVLVDEHARADAVDEDPAGTVHDLEVHQDGAFIKDDGMKYGGPQRLRMRVGVKPGHARLKFRYYFEVFGEVALPAVVAA